MTAWHLRTGSLSLTGAGTGQIRHLNLNRLDELDLAHNHNKAKLSCIRVDELEMLVEAMRRVAEEHDKEQEQEQEQAQEQERVRQTMSMSIPPLGLGPATPRSHAKFRHAKSVDYASASESRRSALPLHPGVGLNGPKLSWTVLTPRKTSAVTDKVVRPAASTSAGVLRKSAGCVPNPYRRMANAADIDRHYAGGRKVSFNDELVLIDEDGTANRISSDKRGS